MAELVAFFSFLATIMTISVALAADDPQSALLGHGCSDRQTYSYVNATAFGENQDAVFASLLSNLSSDGFATTQSTAGKTDHVYGLAVCRKYLTARDCSKCVTAAETQVKEYCPPSNGGQIHMDGCFLRYENTTFYGQGVDNGGSSYCASTNDSDPQTFLQRAQALSAQLITNAYANNSYVTGSIDGSLYGLAQCWPTLINSACQNCLSEARTQLLTCPPHRDGRGLEAGCFMRYSTYSFFTDNQTSQSVPPSGKSSSKIVPILLGSIGGAALLAMVCLILLCRRIRNGKNYDRADDNLAARGNFEQFTFDYEVLRDSTGNFDTNNLLGKGGFGEVYKGRLPDGTDIAVKKLNERPTTQAAAEFLSEVKLLTSVRHRNLVRLLGCCTRGQERLLVYEFMSNNSLDKHLFGEMRNGRLTWENRLKIIVGTARGFQHFGLARFFPEDETHVSTGVGGTIGYTAPEYAIRGQLMEKADVYSYGMVVLEILSGRKYLDVKLADSMRLLLEWAWNQYEKDQVLDIVDSSLEWQYPRE